MRVLAGALRGGAQSGADGYRRVLRQLENEVERLHEELLTATRDAGDGELATRRTELLRIKIRQLEEQIQKLRNQQRKNNTHSFQGHASLREASGVLVTHQLLDSRA